MYNILIVDQRSTVYVQYTYDKFYATFYLHLLLITNFFTYIFFKLIMCSRNGPCVEVLQWLLHTFASQDHQN